MRRTLDFNWHSLHSTSTSKDRAVLEATQAQFDCCGFAGTSRQPDRAVTPCPRNSKGGCASPLLREHTSTLQLLAGYEWLLVALLLASITWCMLFLERARAKRSEESAKDDGGIFGGGDGEGQGGAAGG